MDENKNELLKRRTQDFHFFILVCYVWSVCVDGAPENHFPSVIRFGYYPFIFSACRFQVPSVAHHFRA